MNKLIDFLVQSLQGQQTITVTYPEGHPRMGQLRGFYNPTSGTFDTVDFPLAPKQPSSQTHHTFALAEELLHFLSARYSEEDLTLWLQDDYSVLAYRAQEVSCTWRPTPSRFFKNIKERQSGNFSQSGLVNFLDEHREHLKNNGDLQALKILRQSVESTAVQAADGSISEVQARVKIAGHTAQAPIPYTIFWDFQPFEDYEVRFELEMDLRPTFENGRLTGFQYRFRIEPARVKIRNWMYGAADGEVFTVFRGKPYSVEYEG